MFCAFTLNSYLIIYKLSGWRIFSLFDVSVIFEYCYMLNGLPKALAVKNSPAKICEFDPWVRKILWRRKWQPTPVFLPGESHGGRSLVGYRPGDRRVGHDWATSLSLSVTVLAQAFTVREWPCSMKLGAWHRASAQWLPAVLPLIHWMVRANDSAEQWVHSLLQATH